MKLYRAADAEQPYTGIGSCWAEDPEAAEAYTANPGFGGPQVWVADVEVDTDRVLDLVGVHDERRALARALYDDCDEAEDAYEDWRGSGYDYAYHVWQERRGVREMLSDRYDWIRYEDDYPDGAVTWVRLVGGAVPVQPQR